MRPAKLLADRFELLELIGTGGEADVHRALDHAGIAASDVDLIILATSTPDQTFPDTALQDRLEHAP